MTRTLISATLCAALAAPWLGWGLAWAEPAPGYGGVSPGSVTVPEGMPAAGSAAVVTWPGFQMTPDGGSRVFVQTSVVVKPSLKRAGSTFVLRIPGVSLPRGNARLPLDTRYFKTPVENVRAKQLPDGSVAVTIRVRGKPQPKLTTEKASNGYFFTYVDFVPGA